MPDTEFLFIGGDTHPDSRSPAEFFAALHARQVRHENHLRKTRKYSNTNPIVCVETGKEYASGAHASRELAMSKSAISRHLRGEKENANGLHFRHTLPEKQRKRVKRVLCITTGADYRNVLDCSKKLSITYSKLKKHLDWKGEYTHVNGLKFKYID